LVLISLTDKHITDYYINHNIGRIVINDFSDIKRETNLGKINNQNFVSIPYGKFKQKLSSKCEQLGIEYRLQDESYTSRCSFLDKEPIIKHKTYTYKGKRIKRGLFKTFKNLLVNADVNAVVNILYKFFRK
jgi:IS605 OrfB family transposase